MVGKEFVEAYQPNGGYEVNKEGGQEGLTNPCTTEKVRLDSKGAVRAGFLKSKVEVGISGGKGVGWVVPAFYEIGKSWVIIRVR